MSGYAVIKIRGRGVVVVPGGETYPDISSAFQVAKILAGWREGRIEAMARFES